MNLVEYICEPCENIKRSAFEKIRVCMGISGPFKFLLRPSRKQIRNEIIIKRSPDLGIITSSLL